MTPYEIRLLDLLDRLDAAVKEVRDHIRAGREADPQTARSIEAFADEAFRDRDA